MADTLRRGAWYAVLQETASGDLILDVEGQAVTVHRRQLHRRSDRPTSWSIVVGAGVMRPTLGGQKVVTNYAVCAGCRYRQEFEGKPERLHCEACDTTAPVDWEELA